MARHASRSAPALRPPGLHAGLHDRSADGHPAVLDRRLLGQGGGGAGRSEQDGKGQEFSQGRGMSTGVKRHRGIDAHLKRPSCKMTWYNERNPIAMAWENKHQSGRFDHLLNRAGRGQHKFPKPRPGGVWRLSSPRLQDWPPSRRPSSRLVLRGDGPGDGRNRMRRLAPEAAGQAAAESRRAPSPSRRPGGRRPAARQPADWWSGRRVRRSGDRHPQPCRRAPESPAAPAQSDRTRCAARATAAPTG